MKARLEAQGTLYRCNWLVMTPYLHRLVNIDSGCAVFLPPLPPACHIAWNSILRCHCYVWYSCPSNWSPAHMVPVPQVAAIPDTFELSLLWMSFPPPVGSINHRCIECKRPDSWAAPCAVSATVEVFRSALKTIQTQTWTELRLPEMVSSLFPSALQSPVGIFCLLLSHINVPADFWSASWVSFWWQTFCDLSPQDQQKHVSTALVTVPSFALQGPSLPHTAWQFVWHIQTRDLCMLSSWNVTRGSWFRGCTARSYCHQKFELTCRGVWSRHEASVAGRLSSHAGRRCGARMSFNVRCGEQKDNHVQQKIHESK